MLYSHIQQEKQENGKETRSKKILCKEISIKLFYKYQIMKNIIFLFIPMILLTSCTLKSDGKDYYKNLYASCNVLSSFTKSDCINSVREMETSGYKKAEKSSSGYICPEWMRWNGFLSIWAIWWCEPIKERTTSEPETINTGNITSSGNTNSCPPGMYGDQTSGCTNTPPACPDWQALTGFAGTEFCTNNQ